jgi:hypothetical protein
MVRAKLGGLSWFAIRPGHRVAIAAGSRGIADIAEILRAIVEFLKSLEADPFLFPAMDSHGLATAEGAGCHSGAVGLREASVNAKDLPARPDSNNGRLLQISAYCRPLFLKRKRFYLRKRPGIDLEFF